MSANLNAPALVGGQANPETTTNDAIGVLDAALTEKVVVDLSADVNMTAANFRKAIVYSLTPVGSGKKLTLPAVKRLVYISNDDATDDAIVKRGATEITIAATEGGFFYVDATTDGLVQLSSGGGGGGGGGDKPHDLHIFQPGLPDNSALIFRMNVVREFTLVASLVGSVFNAGTAATGSSIFTISQNGSSIGTITYSAAGTTGAVVFGSDVAFAINDVITITGQATADATLADISFDFLGSIT